MQPFSQKQIDLVATFANQAVIAIENARLINETHEALEQQTATAEVLQVINSSPGNLTPVFETILEKAHSLCGVAYGSLQLYDGEQFRAVAVHGLAEPLADRLRQGYSPGPNLPNRRLLEGARFAHIPDLAAIDDPMARSSVELGGMRTLLCVALRKDDVLLGQIVAARPEVQPFSDKQIALLEGFANQAVIAIENARLLTELRSRNSELAEALEYQTATSEVLRIVASSPDDLRPVFEAMLEKAMGLCQAKFGFLLLYDGEAYSMVTARNVPAALAEALRAGPHRPGPNAALGRLARTKAPVHIEDVRDDIAYVERDAWRVAAVEAGGARAQLAVPLLKKGELIGAFIIYRQEPRAFADNQIALVTT
ncbi:MAG: GAF domain-containing protein, partial [Roseiarcus sp.]